MHRLHYSGRAAFLRGKGQGWLTAEYGMLPGATHTRSDREAARGKQSGRTQEIQRLIGRSLRMAVDLSALGEITLKVDCDVLQADGGTRTAAISGACVALMDALASLEAAGRLPKPALTQRIAAVSVGVVKGVPVLDLDYDEDSTAETDMNVVLAEDLRLIEVQGTAEGAPFSAEELTTLVALAQQGERQLFAAQDEALRA